MTRESQEYFLLQIFSNIVLLLWGEECINSKYVDFKIIISCLICIHKRINISLGVTSPAFLRLIHTFLDFNFQKLPGLTPSKSFKLNMFALLWTQHLLHLMMFKKFIKVIANIFPSAYVTYFHLNNSVCWGFP